MFEVQPKKFAFAKQAWDFYVHKTTFVFSQNTVWEVMTNYWTIKGTSICLVNYNCLKDVYLCLIKYDTKQLALRNPTIYSEYTVLLCIVRPDTAHFVYFYQYLFVLLSKAFINLSISFRLFSWARILTCLSFFKNQFDIFIENNISCIFLELYDFSYCTKVGSHS